PARGTEALAGRVACELHTGRGARGRGGPEREERHAPRAGGREQAALAGPSRGPRRRARCAGALRRGSRGRPARAGARARQWRHGERGRARAADRRVPPRSGGFGADEALTGARRGSYHRRDPRLPMARTPRQPISARHAFARAFDLAVRRDPVQSLWVPLLLHAPWLLLKALVPSPDDPGGHTLRNLQLNSLQLLGDFPVSLLIASMLRFRARSVHQSADGLKPAPALECYGRGARRMPWLLATEVLRNVAIVAGLVAVLPALWVGFRFSL